MDTKRTQLLTVFGIIVSMTINLKAVSEEQIREALAIPKVFKLEGGKIADALDVRKIKNALDVCFPKIEQVEFSCCVMREKFVKNLMQTLKKHPLQQFSLKYSAVSLSGFKTMFRMLKKHDLICIHLQGVGLNTSGAKYFSNLLQEEKHLQQLDLQHVEMTLEGLEAVANGLAENNTLEILNLRDCIAMEGKSTEKLKEVFSKLLDNKEDLSEINLAGFGMGDDCASELVNILTENCNSITKINLARNKIGDEGLAKIADMLPLFPLLKEVKLERNNIGPKGAKALAEVLGRCSSIEKISLYENPLGNEGATAIAEALTRTSLQELVLGANGTDGKGMAEVCKLLRTTKIMHLWIDYASSTFPCMEELAREIPVIVWGHK